MSVSQTLDKDRVEAAVLDLSSCDQLGRLVKRFPRPEYRLTENVFRALVRIIVFQQLSGKVAEVIYGRLADALGADMQMTPEHVLSLEPETLRIVGLSRQKSEYIRGISQTFHDLELTTDTVFRMPDDEIRERLLPIKGVGNWTIDMFLIFHLARPDVFPTGDLAIHNALCSLVSRDRMKPQEMAEHAERWAPHRTVAAHYLWSSLDIAEDQVPS